MKSKEELTKIYNELNESEKYGIHFGLFPVKLIELSKDEISGLMQIRIEKEKYDINKDIKIGGLKMRKLDIEEIERLAGKENVRQIAVENFLGSMGSDNRIAILNMRRDAKMYGWNSQTIKAIEQGIILASGS